MAQLLVETLFNSPGATWQFVNSGISNTTGLIMPAGTRAGDLVIFAAAASGTGGGGQSQLPQGDNGISGYAGYKILANLTTTTASTNTTIGYIDGLPASNTGFVSMARGGTIVAGICYVYRRVNIPTFLLDVIPANSSFITSNATGKNTAPIAPPITTIPQTNFIIIFGTQAANVTPTAPAGYTRLAYQSNSGATVMGAVTLQQSNGTITPGQFGNGAGTTNSFSSATIALRTKLISAVVPFNGTTAGINGNQPTVYSQNAVITATTTANAVITSELPGVFPISISGGTNSAFSVNGGAFTNSATFISLSTPGAVANIAVSQTTTNTAPGVNNTSTATLTVGNQSNTFNLITARSVLRNGNQATLTFNYDANVSTVTIYAVGGGGCSNSTQSGGSGGTFVRRTLASINSTASVVVDAGAGADTTFGPQNGANSTVTIAGTVVALARGGISANTTSGGVAVTTGSVGNSIFSGGNGGTGNTTLAGGGGGAGGYTGAGGAGGGANSAGVTGTNDAAGGGGGAGTGGNSYGGGGGGGTGVSGPGTAGAGGAAGSGGTGGGEGSPDASAASGAAGALLAAGAGGTGGGGGGGYSSSRSQGGDGIIKIIW